MLDPNEFLYTFIDNLSIQLLSIIGSGSYGVVYLGKYVYTNRYYAVKCMADNHTAENEINMHSMLSGHSNILTLEKVVKQNNFVFIIMEYATHGDLFSSITKPHLSVDIIGKSKVIRHLFLQILDAVQHCHYNLLAHRDLKPENILLLSNHRVKLADFGLTTNQLLSKEFNCGSSFYFSPECQGVAATNNKPVPYYDTVSNDIWSLGVILINLVSGRNPWKQANLEDPAFAAYVKHPRRFFRTILPGISKSFDRILIRIFCLNPTKRITLPELRIMILNCRSFTASTSTEMPINVDGPITPPSSQEVRCSKSFASTVTAYIGDYIDDNETSFFCSSDHENEERSSCSSNNTEDDPPTPSNISPLISNEINNFRANGVINKREEAHCSYFDQMC